MNDLELILNLWAKEWLEGLAVRWIYLFVRRQMMSDWAKARHSFNGHFGGGTPAEVMS